MFNAFHRHQKTLMKWFAVLTILSMFGFAFSGAFRGPGQQGGTDVHTVETIYGHNITNRDIEQAKFEREIANRFLIQAIAAVDPLARQYPPYLDYQLERLGFGPSRDDEDIKNALRLSYKADELGIRVDDDMVESWIKRVTQGKLTNDQFRSAVRSLPSRDITPQTLYDILRKQLRIRHVRELALGHRFGFGSAQVTPYEAWQFYRRLHDRVALAIVPVPTDRFTDSIPDPGDDVLFELYNKYAQQTADPSSPEPGFEEPHKVQLEYAHASVEDFLAKLEPEVTDAEIAAYYEANQERYRVLTAPPSKDQEPSQEAAPEPPAKPDENSDKPQPTTPPDKSDATPGDKPEHGAAAPDPAPSPVGKRNESTTPKADAAGTEQGTPCEDSGKQDPVAEKSGKAAEPAAQSSDRKDPAAAAPAKEEPSKDQAAEPAATTADDKPPAKPEQEPHYKSLEEVAPEIKQQLAREKAAAELLRQLEAAERLINQFAETVYLQKRTEFEASNEKAAGTARDGTFVPPAPPDVSDAVAELGLALDRTELVSQVEISKIAGVGSARELGSDATARRAVEDVMPSTDLFEPREFKNSADEYFAVWKIGDEPAHTPPFHQMRDKVLAAYRAIEARKPARERTEELAAALREAGSDTAAFHDAHPDAELISLPPVPLWSSAAQFSPMTMAPSSQIVPTDIPGVPMVDDAFRQTVFRLKEGETAVLPNVPENTYYAVLATKREGASYEAFAKERASVESQLEAIRVRDATREWFDTLREEASSDQKASVPRG